MANSWHVNWLKEGVIPWNQRRRKVKFTPDLEGTNFYEILPKDYREAPKAKASRFFEKINLSGANLTNTNLSHLNFKQANFTDSDLSGANLEASNFEDAKFKNASLRGCTAERAIFRNAIFTQSDLESMSFVEADVTFTKFIESPLTSNQEEQFGENIGVQIIASVADYKKMTRSSQLIESSVGYNEVPSPKRDKNTRYDVFYGTNRKPKLDRDELVGYGNQFDTKINYGICEVIIPDSHKVGKLGSSLWGKLIKKEDDRLKVRQLIGLNPELYWSHINALSQKMKVKEKPTIFVHGYNNTFKQAALRAAQIGHDLGIGQGIGLFSWPSKGRKRKYPADEDAVNVSKYLLAEFIEGFIEKTEHKSANIIAHSMGCRCLMGAFEVLAANKKSVLKRVNQVILAAADIDVRHMDALGKHAVNNCARTTSYVAPQDKALLISSWFHDFRRVGIVPPTYVLNGMDTVVVNNAQLWKLGHGYVASNKSVLMDIFNLLKNNDDPADRFSIELVTGGVPEHWKIRE